MQVEGQHGLSLLSLMATGARVSNAYATYLSEGDNPSKGGLIPHTTENSHEIFVKGESLTDRHAFH